MAIRPAVILDGGVKKQMSAADVFPVSNIPEMGAASAGAAGTAGAVPASVAGDQNKVLTAGKIWVDQPPDGSVTTVSVVSANGFAGTVATATTTPAITLSTSITGILEGNGTAISAAAATGTGNVVRATSPILVTPALGAATATTVNKMAITQPATASTLTVANGKTLTASNTLTLVGTDGQTHTFQGTDTIVGRATTDTLTNKTLTSPKLNEDVVLSATATQINGLVTPPLQTVSSASGVLTLDYAAGRDFKTTLTENITSIVVQNPPASGKAGEFTLTIVQAATPKAITWPDDASANTFHWGSGGYAAPSITGTAVLKFYTNAQGEPWHGILVSNNQNIVTPMGLWHGAFNNYAFNSVKVVKLVFSSETVTPYANNLAAPRAYPSALANDTYGIFAGGATTAGVCLSSSDKTTYSTGTWAGSSALSGVRRSMTGIGNKTIAFAVGGTTANASAAPYPWDGAATNTVEKWTFSNSLRESSTALERSNASSPASTGTEEFGIIGHGNTGAYNYNNAVSKLTFADGSSTSKTATWTGLNQCRACGSTTYGIFAGSNGNTTDYRKYVFATDVNSDQTAMAVKLFMPSSAGSSTKGYWTGSISGSTTVTYNWSDEVKGTATSLLNGETNTQYRTALSSAPGGWIY